MRGCIIVTALLIILIMLGYLIIYPDQDNLAWIVDVHLDQRVGIFDRKLDEMNKMISKTLDQQQHELENIRMQIAAFRKDVGDVDIQKIYAEFGTLKEQMVSLLVHEASVHERAE